MPADIERFTLKKLDFNSSEANLYGSKHIQVPYNIYRSADCKTFIVAIAAAGLNDIYDGSTENLKPP